MPISNLSINPALVQDTFVEYFQRKLLKNIETTEIFSQFGQKDDIPRRSGRVASWIGIEELDLPANPLSEGVAPVLDSISTRKVQATAIQWGAGSDISDIGDFTPFHDVWSNLVMRQSRQARRLKDRECQKVLQGATNLSFADNVASRSLLTASNRMDTEDVKRNIASLRSTGAPPFEYGRDGRVTTGKYVLIVDPAVEADLRGDATFVQASAFQDKSLYNGMIAENWQGASVISSNFIPVIRGYASPTTSAPAGTLAAGTYFIVVEYVNPFSKFVEGVTIETSRAVAAGQGLGITLPTATVPGSTRQYLYNIYVGSSTGTEVLQSGQTLLTGGATVVLNTVNSTGPAPTAQAPLGLNVHTSYFLGMGAYGVTDMMELEMKQTTFAPDKSDILGQRKTSGWKAMFVPVILNNPYMRRFESVSPY